MSHYMTLGVQKDANRDEIKKAHRRLARKYHPDVSTEENAKDKFQAVQRAYEVLEDPERRAHYDQTGQDNKDDPLVGARDLLADVWKQTLIRTLDVPWASMTRVAGFILDEMQDKINKQLVECRGVLKKMAKHKGRVKVKEGEHNIHLAVVEAEEEKVKAMIANHPAMLANINLARKMLKDCESQEQYPQEAGLFPFRSIFDGNE